MLNGQILFKTSPSKHINPDTQKEQHGLLHEPGEVTLYGIEETVPQRKDD